MSLFDFLLPKHRRPRLGSLDDRLKWATKKAEYRKSVQHKLEARIVELETGIGTLSLVLAGLLDLLEEKSLVSRTEITSRFKKLDLLDGNPDGQLDLEFLRAWLDQQT